MIDLVLVNYNSFPPRHGIITFGGLIAFCNFISNFLHNFSVEHNFCYDKLPTNHCHPPQSFRIMFELFNESTLSFNFTIFYCSVVKYIIIKLLLFSHELAELGWLLVPCCVEIEMGHILLVLRQTKLFLSDWNEIEYKVGNYQL